VAGEFDQAQDQEPGLGGKPVVVIGVVLAHRLGGQRLGDLLDQEPGAGGGGAQRGQRLAPEPHRLYQQIAAALHDQLARNTETGLTSAG